MTLASTAPEHAAFRHEALLYSGEAGFLAGTLPFLREGVAAGEPTLVVVSAARIAALKGALDGASEAIQFADMAEVGHNPARIIPAWQEFLDRNGGGARPVRGIGEPIFPERTADELVECQRHESLLNVAFGASGAWTLLCPYDVEVIPPAIIQEVERNHPFINHDGTRRASATCRDVDDMAEPFDARLSEPTAPVTEMVFADVKTLHKLRAFITDYARGADMSQVRAEELVLAVHEAAANSVRYGGGQGTLRMWTTDRAVVCEVIDAGHPDDPLVGRVRPMPESVRGRGLWMANQLCDLVQLRTYPTSNVVRLHMERSPGD